MILSHTVERADAIDFLRAQPPDSIDLVFFSPPYEQARLYLENGENLGISRDTAAWVEWMAEVWAAAQAACKGLVAGVVAGQTKNYRWSAGPALLMAELHRRGFNLRNPPIYHRVGIPGSGGPDWLRSDYEWVVCTTRPGRLPWSENTAFGHAPKWAPGGEMSHRRSAGMRVNQWGGNDSSYSGKKRNGQKDDRSRPSHRMHTKRQADGEMESQGYDPPAIANPGNLIHCAAGGNQLGNDLCHENEAPFPEKLAEFFVCSFCPPGGWVSDPFSGSGTTASVAKRHGRNFKGCDLRQSQVDLSLRRLAGESTLLFT
jgi:hypothetical protein